MNFSDALVRRIGTSCSWLIFFMALITTMIVVARKGFDVNSIAIQELVSYLHATVFMLAIPWALQEDEHVRVDILYRRMPSVKKRWVNIVGGITCLLPFALFCMSTSFDFVAKSWEIFENSPQANGLHGVFILKTIVPISFFLLAVQGLSIIVRDTGYLMAEPK